MDPLFDFLLLASFLCALFGLLGVLAGLADFAARLARRLPCMPNRS